MRAFCDKICKVGRCSWIFSNLPPEGFGELTSLLEYIEYGRGEIIFQEGAPAFGLYIVCDGKVKLVRRSPDKRKKQLLKLLGPGEILGEETLFEGGRYIAYAKTLEESKVHLIRREDFFSFIGKYPSINLRIIEKLAREVKGFQSKLVEIAYEDSEERLARILIQMGEKYGKEEDEGLYIGVMLSRSEMAEMAGVSTETAIRTLSKLKGEGLIDLKGHKVIILNKKGLQEIAKPFPISLRENLL
jgi:CRP/FNR family transcriptional regulator